MNDAEMIAAIQKIIRTRPRMKGADRASVEAADLTRYDQIVGLLRRHVPGNAAAVIDLLNNDPTGDLP